MTEPRPDQPPFRLIVAGMGAGVVLMVLGAFVSFWLVGLGAALVAFVPLVYAARQVRRHAVYIPEEPHPDQSMVGKIARMIERNDLPPPRRRQ